MMLFKKETISDEGRIKIEKAVISATYPVHTHEFIELVYIMAGGGSQFIDGREYQVSHGSLLFIDYGQTHSMTPKHSMTYVHILLEPEFFSRELVNVESILDIFCYNMFSEFSGKQESAVQCVTFPKEELAKVDHLIEIMLQEYEQKNPGYLSVLRASTQTLFAWLLRKMNSGTDTVLLDSMQDVVEYINEHFTEKLVLGDIAAKGFYNPDYMSRLLKKYCGKSFSQYVKEKRIARAGNLLRTTDLPINDIMLQSGYTDSKMFYQHFKEIYHESPGSVRRKK
ncbi:MAG: helix-turn-helix domain-containing protein [Lachnospiraceae bacterium]|nr:helix-turn-helix domain-containing protein [Lachnospiraceae bacterium]